VWEVLVLLDNNPVKPNHYHRGDIDVIEFMIRHFGNNTKVTPAQGFFIGNVIKYTCRFMDKNGLEDLEKAKYYLNQLAELEHNPKETE